MRPSQGNYGIGPADRVRDDRKAHTRISVQRAGKREQQCMANVSQKPVAQDLPALPLPARWPPHGLYTRLQPCQWTAKWRPVCVYVADRLVLLSLSAEQIRVDRSGAARWTRSCAATSTTISATGTA